MTGSVDITTGSRLHFGPLFCGRSPGRQFGGVGVMIDRPGCRVTIGPSDRNELFAPADVRAVAEKCVATVSLAEGEAGPVCIEVHESIPRHRGLGSGTQTALAVAQGLHVLRRGRPADAPTLARITGRGLRSAVGIHGFQHGGFLIDAGKQNADSLGALAAQCAVPGDWRFVLIAPRDAAGLSGRTERDAFSRLPAMPHATSGELCRIALTELLPAVRDADFPMFAEALFAYGRIVGEFFTPVQGGCFAHAETGRLAAKLRDGGFAGVAQSSWGPTIAVVTPDETAAAALAAEVTNSDNIPNAWCVIAPPRNVGARVH